jgi:hypothetical protein
VAAIVVAALAVVAEVAGQQGPSWPPRSATRCHRRPGTGTLSRDPCLQSLGVQRKGEDEDGAGDAADLAGAGGDVLEGAPADTRAVCRRPCVLQRWQSLQVPGFGTKSSPGFRRLDW